LSALQYLFRNIDNDRGYAMKHKVGDDPNADIPGANNANLF